MDNIKSKSDLPEDIKWVWRFITEKQRRITPRYEISIQYVAWDYTQTEELGLYDTYAGAVIAVLRHALRMDYNNGVK